MKMVCDLKSFVNGVSAGFCSFSKGGCCPEYRYNCEALVSTNLRSQFDYDGEKELGFEYWQLLVYQEKEFKRVGCFSIINHPGP